MNKRIRIATTSTYPEGMASTYRVHCYAKGLKEEEVPIEVVSAKALKRKEGKAFFYKGNNSDIPFTILWNRGKFRRMVFNYLWSEVSSYVLMLHCVLTARQFDILWLYGMGLVPRLMLLPFMHLMGKKVVLELNEYPYSTEGNKYTRIPWVRKAMQRGTLKLVIPQFDGVVVISENLYQVVKHHAPQVPVLKVPILIEKKKSEQYKKSKTAVINNGIPYIFHAGSLSQKKDGIVKVFEAYAQAASKLKSEGKELDFIITNKTTQLSIWSVINGILKKHDLLNNVKITGYLDNAALEAHLQQAQVLVINKPATFQNKYNFPTKLGDYLLSGRPVVVASEGVELNTYLKHGLNAFIVKPDDVEGMAHAIEILYLNTDLAHRIGWAGRKSALESFDYRINAKKTQTFLNQLL